MTRKSVSFGMRKSRVGAQLEGARRAAASGGVPRPRAARTESPALPGARRAPSDGAPARLLRQPNRYDFSAVARFSEEKRIVFEQ